MGVIKSVDHSRMVIKQENETILQQQVQSILETLLPHDVPMFQDDNGPIHTATQIQVVSGTPR